MRSKSGHNHDLIRAGVSTIFHTVQRLEFFINLNEVFKTIPSMSDIGPTLAGIGLSKPNV